MSKGLERLSDSKPDDEPQNIHSQNREERKRPVDNLYERLEEIFDSPGSYPIAQEKILNLFAESEIDLVSRKQILSLFEGQVQPDATAGKVLNRLNKRIEKFGFSIQGEYFYRLTHLDVNNDG